MNRLDWRFLLPDPPDGRPYRHLVLLGGSPALADQIVQAGLAERVSAASQQSGSVDALVILNGAGRAARTSLDQLGPGGVVYWETRRPARAQRELRGAGVRLTGHYWSGEPFAQARVCLPVDRPAALRWYLSTMFLAETPGQRLLEPGLRLAARLGAAWTTRWPAYHALTGTSGSADCASPSVLGHPGRPPHLQRPGLRPLMLTRRDGTGRVIILPFSPDGRRPVAAMKLARSADHNDATEQEQQVLAALRAGLGPRMCGSVPRPLGTFRWGQLTVGAETCAPGRLMSTSIFRWGAPFSRKVDELRRVAAWLARLHVDAPVARTTWNQALVNTWVDEPLSNYARRFNVNPAEKRLFEAVRARARALTGRPVPLVWTHWDLGPQNIFRHRAGLVVVDWEGGSPAPPGLDLILFATHWSYAARGLNTRPLQLRGLRDLYCTPGPRHPACVAAREALDAYLSRVAIDPGFLPVLLIMTWAFRSLTRAQGDSRLGNPYIDYLGLMAEHTATLFGAD